MSKRTAAATIDADPLLDAARGMYAALGRIAQFYDFPPLDCPPGTDPEHMWHEMVMIARHTVAGVDLALDHGWPSPRPWPTTVPVIPVEIPFPIPKEDNLCWCAGCISARTHRDNK